MYKLILLAFLFCFTGGWAQSEMVFKNPKEMADYAFSHTNFGALGNPFLVNRTMEIDPEDYSRFLAGSSDFVKGSDNIGLFSLFEWWDMNGTFKRDSILFPVYDHFYRMDEETALHIPLFITDMNVQKLKPGVWESFKSSNSTDPFPAISGSDILQEHLETASIFLDSFAYNNVFVKFDASTFITNGDREVSQVILRSNGFEKVLNPGVPVSLSDWLSDRVVEIEVQFTDGSSFTKQQQVEWSVRARAIEKESPDFEGITHRQYFDPNSDPSIDNPEAKYGVYYACDDKKLRKPYLMVTGWGPHTDRRSINEDQGWPTPFYNLVEQYNGDGLLEQLHEQGFDIVFVQFYPPNASILKNSVVLEKVINWVNDTKTANGSFEENIIMGQSAGALAVKLTLQMMEKKHLENNGPHPHTKLFVSYDGENGGANIPLGAQHAVKYLWDYEYNPNPLFINHSIYALNYILSAPLSQELMLYSYVATGSGDSPGQGSSGRRTMYLSVHDYLNHSMNSHVPRYPSFQRNISISNGSSVPHYNMSDFSCEHVPYPEETGHIFFKQSGTMMGWVNRRFEATLAKHGVHRVFYYEYKPFLNGWRVGYEASTNNPLVLDNAPGGIMFISANPIKQVNNQLQCELTGAPDYTDDPLFAFTPTVLTHDIKNFMDYTENGYPNYSLKENRLLYDNEVAAAGGNIADASDFFGYPHLGYPTDHYSITPFDAVFSWSQNTEHLIGNRKSNAAYEGEWTPVRPVIKNFIADEAEAWNILLQNKRIGNYSRPGYTYRVDYEAIYGIYLGEHITQKTDFLEMTSESNAVVEAQAGKEIVFFPGSHLKYGTTFHAFIGDITCEKSASVVGHGDGNSDRQEASAFISEASVNDDPMVYPNPNSGSFFVKWAGLENGSILKITIFDMTGKEVFASTGRLGAEIQHELRKGIYVVKIQTGTACFSKRIIVD